MQKSSAEVLWGVTLERKANLMGLYANSDKTVLMKLKLEKFKDTAKEETKWEDFKFQRVEEFVS